MVKKVEGSVALANQLVEAIAKSLKEIYGSYWNFEIDLEKDSDVTKNFVIRVKVYKK